MSGIYLPHITPAQAQPDPATETAPLATSQQARNLDGIYLLLGVGGAASHIENEWDSSIGGHLAITTVSEGRAISLLALEGGLSQYGARDGGRAWLAPALGSRRLGPLVGLSAGVSAEWDLTEPPKWGAVATAWMFVGLVPTVSVGHHQRTGTFVELGLRITLPALRLGRRGLL